MNVKKTLIMIMACSWQTTLFAQETSTQESVDNPVQVVEQLPKADPEKAAKDLQNAYKKEYAFLTTQIKNIKQRTKEFQQTAKADKAQINQEISLIENKLLELDNITSQLEDDVFQVERTTESASDNNNLLEATITQAKSTMSEFDFNDFDENSDISDIDKISLLVEGAKNTIANNSIITKKQGSFFLDNGQEVNGTIIKVGNIASYGNSSNGSGPLAPAGEKKFKVWRDSDKEAIANMFNGNPAASLPIFLYESSVKSIEEKQQKTVLSVINSGGVIAWIITVLGIFALILVVLRFWFLKRASASTEKILNKVVGNIENKDRRGGGRRRRRRRRRATSTAAAGRGARAGAMAGKGGGIRYRSSLAIIAVVLVLVIVGVAHLPQGWA